MEDGGATSEYSGGWRCNYQVGRWHLLLLHKQPHNKRGIPESLHKFIWVIFQYNTMVKVTHPPSTHTHTHTHACTHLGHTLRHSHLLQGSSEHHYPSTRPHPLPPPPPFPTHTHTHTHTCCWLPQNITDPSTRPHPLLQRGDDTHEQSLTAGLHYHWPVLFLHTILTTWTDGEGGGEVRVVPNSCHLYKST